ncbi:luciferin 4-monooxygenase-like isoform X2 [Folsomia candida]|uniref:luciferin 4-monooxygenase-like isoform X2 n=1 Tax=Folsomia candida TaxID=158441 RepID=UPI001604F317|nr:luciferin 4-monooxygenase-like isoform X2 [Folsomia candida]
MSSLKYAVTAGQVVGPSFVRSVRAISSLTSLYVIYGMTEIGLISVNADWSALHQHNVHRALNEFPAFSCGKLAPGNELRVKDIDTGVDLGPGKIGEFYFRSPYAFAGYFRNSLEVTKDSFHNDWIPTGDVGFYDEEGFIYIKDRIKEIFKYFNNHICPSELENVLLRHPNVAQACVVGVPDPEGGDMIPRGFIVPKNMQDVNCTAEEIVEFANRQLPNYKHFRGGAYFVKQLPHGKTGKTSRQLVQQLQVY